MRGPVRVAAGAVLALLVVAVLSVLASPVGLFALAFTGLPWSVVVLVAGMADASLPVLYLLAAACTGVNLLLVAGGWRLGRTARGHRAGGGPQGASGREEQPHRGRR